MVDIRIARLEIRMKGISQEEARASVLGLPEELARQLAAVGDRVNDKRGININRIESGTLETGEDGGRSDLRGKIAGRIVRSISAKIQ